MLGSGFAANDGGVRLGVMQGHWTGEPVGPDVWVTCRELIPAGSVFAFLVEHREELFPATCSPTCIPRSTGARVCRRRCWPRRWCCRRCRGSQTSRRFRSCAVTVPTLAMRRHLEAGLRAVAGRGRCEGPHHLGRQCGLHDRAGAPARCRGAQKGDCSRSLPAASTPSLTRAKRARGRPVAGELLRSADRERRLA
jgi:hypothetical protein